MENLKIYNEPRRGEWIPLTERVTRQEDEITQRVAGILEAVKSGGDEALRRLTLEIEGRELGDIEVSAADRAGVASRVAPELKDALGVARRNIEAFHRAQLSAEIVTEVMGGVRCVQRSVPIERVGLYIPGGKAPLFSTVLMLALPARVAGCKEVVLCTPAGVDGKVNPEILYAAEMCGVDRVFAIGGAQAVAAMAYGTASVPRVDKIFGPGNRYVTKAKQLVGANVVAVDMPAGPSEVLVLADDSASPEFAAADFLSQAEHGGDSQSVLVCESMAFAEATRKAISAQMKKLNRTEIIDQSLAQSRIVVLADRDERIAFSNLYAPEHLIIMMSEPWSAAERVTAAGSVFVGQWSPESAGDYASGTNHTLPTSGWARSYSGVNTDAFMRKITFQELTREGLESLAPTITAMAMAEGLDAHASAVTVRLNSQSR